MPLTVAPMKTVGDIRRANLELLIEEAKKLEVVAEAAGTTSVYLSQIRNQAKDVKTGKPREMGSKMARRIETGMNLSPGWFDIDHAGKPAGPSATPEPRGVRSVDEILVNSLADRLLALPSEAAARSVDACRRLAESPDSQRSRDALVDLIAWAPDGTVMLGQVKQFAAPRLDPALGMLADRWPIDSEREVIQRFLDTVTQFMAENRDSPKSGTGTEATVQHTKATSREN